jgi:DNA-binding GntR family transcriptional regulator
VAQLGLVRATNDLESTLAQRAYSELKDLIVTLALPPGATLREGDLQERLEVGRTPLREALHRLAHEGMLHIYPRRAIVVAKLGMSEVRQVFEVRLALETSAAALAAERATAGELAALAALGARLRASRSEVDVSTFLHTDQAFHRAIVEYARNALLAGYVDHIQSLNLWLWHSYFQTRPTRGIDLFEHDPIIAAIAAGDAPAAAAAMGAHIRLSKEQLLSRW